MEEEAREQLQLSPGASPAPVLPAWSKLTHPIYDLRAEFWERQERLYVGGATMRVDELPRWPSVEKDGGEHYELRLNTAAYINLPKKHATTMTGHLRRKAPKPGKGYDFGSMGHVRPRSEYRAENASTAEQLWYNCDGVGSDGSQFDVFHDTVSDWAQVTGFRWILTEMPAFSGQGTPSQADVNAGLHPYFVHLSPLDVPFWWDIEGRLDMAVLRVPVDLPDLDEEYIPQPDHLGYYILVRKGSVLLADTPFAGGGWWMWDSRMNFVDARPWTHASGEIPMYPFISVPDAGTRREPNIGASQTEELGQIAVGIMNLISARDSDAIDAAKSELYVLGADGPTITVIGDQLAAGSQIIGVPAVGRQTDIDGSVSYQMPSVYDGSMGAVSANVFDTILASKWTEAQKIMIDQVSSTPDSSGRSKQAGFTEQSSPLLARMASTREQAENTGLYFYALRSGKAADATVEWPKEFDLAPVVEDIDAMFDTLRRAAQFTASPTLNTALIEMALVERHLNLDPGIRAKVVKELEADAQAQSDAKTAMNQAKTAAFTGGAVVPPGAGGSPGAQAAQTPKTRPIPLPLAIDPNSAGST